MTGEWTVDRDDRARIDLSKIEVPDNSMTRAYAEECRALKAEPLTAAADVVDAAVRWAAVFNNQIWTDDTERQRAEVDAALLSAVDAWKRVQP